MAAASARIEMGDVGGAMRDLKEMAGELADKGRQAEAIEVLREAAKLNADDEEIREKLLDVHHRRRRLRAGARIRDDARAVPDDRRGARGPGPGRRGARRRCARRRGAASRTTPSSRASWRAAFIARGDLATAAEYLTVETAGDDPALLLTVADMQLRGDTARGGPGDRPPAARSGSGAPRADRAARLERRRAGARSRLRRRRARRRRRGAPTDWPGAAAALQEFVTRVPNHIPALMRLVEICVDGGLEATMYSAQAQLADAYIAAGAGDRGPLHRRGSGRARAVGQREHRAVPPRAGAAGRAGSRRADRGAAERRVAVHEHRPLQPQRVRASRRSRRRRSSEEQQAEALADAAGVRGRSRRSRPKKSAPKAGAAQAARSIISSSARTPSTSTASSATSTSRRRRRHAVAARRGSRPQHRARRHQRPGSAAPARRRRRRRRPRTSRTCSATCATSRGAPAWTTPRRNTSAGWRCGRRATSTAASRRWRRRRGRRSCGSRPRG